MPVSPQLGSGPRWSRVAVGLLLAASAQAQSAVRPVSAPPRAALAGAVPSSLADPGFFDDGRVDAAPPESLSMARRVDTGQWLISYRYERTSFHGLRDRRDDVSSRELFGSGYTVAGRDLDADVHTLEVHYGATDDWTLFARLPYLHNDLDSETSDGHRFGTNTSGIGDIILGVNHNLVENDGEVWRAHLGVGLPTGSFDERDRDGGGTRQAAPFVVQLGTGTVDLFPGLTYMVQHEEWSYGVGTEARLRLGTNGEGWARSNSLQASLWASRLFAERLSGSLQLNADSHGDYHGSWHDVDPDANPLEDENRQGGTLVELAAGVRYGLPEPLGASTLGLELGVPIDQWVDGPALDQQWRLALAWQFSF